MSSPESASLDPAPDDIELIPIGLDTEGNEIWGQPDQLGALPAGNTLPPQGGTTGETGASATGDTTSRFLAPGTMPPAPAGPGAGLAPHPRAPGEPDTGDGSRSGLAPQPAFLTQRAPEVAERAPQNDEERRAAEALLTMANSLANNGFDISPAHLTSALARLVNQESPYPLPEGRYLEATDTLAWATAQELVRLGVLTAIPPRIRGQQLEAPLFTDQQLREADGESEAAQMFAQGRLDLHTSPALVAMAKRPAEWGAFMTMLRNRAPSESFMHEFTGAVSDTPWEAPKLPERRAAEPRLTMHALAQKWWNEGARQADKWPIAKALERRPILGRRARNRGSFDATMYGREHAATLFEALRVSAAADQAPMDYLRSELNRFSDATIAQMSGTAAEYRAALGSNPRERYAMHLLTHGVSRPGDSNRITRWASQAMQAAMVELQRLEAEETRRVGR